MMMRLFGQRPVWRVLMATVVAAFLLIAGIGRPAFAGDPYAPASRTDSFSGDELVDAGHKFFGGVSNGLADVIEKAASRYGQPNGYILGQQMSGALVVGATYGEGTLYTRNAGRHKVYIQGPSLGIDFGGDGARIMILVYSLPAVDQIYQRFGGISGSAYFIGGFGMTALQADKTVIVPVRSGLGARLGVSMEYLKLTRDPTWNPF